MSRSPIASVPISASVAAASSRVPPTPAFASRAHLSASAYAQEKQAFLAPFETFFDALTDAAQLKTWLAEQLARAQRLEDMVERAVEKRVGAMREDVGALRRRVEELEGVLRAATNNAASGSGRPAGLGVVQSAPPHAHSQVQSQVVHMHAHTQGQGQGQGPLGYHPPPPHTHTQAQAHTPTLSHAHAHTHSQVHASPSSSTASAKGKSKANGTPVHSHSHSHSQSHSSSLPLPPAESYTFPPVAPRDRDRDRERDREREGEQESRSFPGSPIPGRRLSVSAIRLETRKSDEEGQGQGQSQSAHTPSSQGAPHKPSARGSEEWWEKESKLHSHPQSQSRSPVRPGLQRRVSGPPGGTATLGRGDRGERERGDRDRDRERHGMREREEGELIVVRREMSPEGMSVDDGDEDEEG